MRQKYKMARALKSVERPPAPTNTVGVASSISSDGHTVNGQNYSDGEVRDLEFALPYGISSSGLDGIRIQIITNGNKNNIAVGVIDKNRPPVKAGCLILYDKAGSTISFNGDGSIDINAKTIRINGVEV